MSGNLLEHYIYRRKQLDYEIKRHKRREHEELLKRQAVVFRLMDTKVLLLVLMNFGAVTLTNVLLIKQQPDAILLEANTIQAEAHGYEQHPQASSLIKALVYQAFLWALLLFCYIYYRRRVYNEKQMWVMLGIVSFYFMLCGIDFFNNYGYYIGRMMFS